jgi:hypothetical protein
MATKFGLGGKSFFTRVLGGIVIGIFGYILGSVLATIGIFPVLKWDDIGLLLGILVGAFYEELNGYFE